MTFKNQWTDENRKMRVGDTIAQQVYIPPTKTFSQKIIFGVRVNEIIDQVTEKGFSYETLEGHVEKAPERAMAEARAMVAAGERVGVLFGPERAGLETADVVRANAVISVTVNPEYGSLNLAQCVLLMAYEWMRSGDAGPAADYRTGDGRRAQGAEVDRFVTHLTERLDAVGFFFPEHKRARMLANLDNLFRRSPLTDADVRILHGVVRALAETRPGRK
jgi:tRNA C32,U32 (ribose-2'-O)-methylase TrmJ